MKKTVWIIVGILILITVVTFVVVNHINNTGVKFQVIEFDIMDDSEKVVKKGNVKVDNIIKLKKYDGNNIKILEINDENVKISRDAIRYEIISQTSLYSGEVKEYVETVVETVNYDTLISIDIDSNHPFGPEYVQYRYYYKIRFVK